jgi:hypothetical protein
MPGAPRHHVVSMPALRVLTMALILLRTVINFDQFRLEPRFDGIETVP